VFGKDPINMNTGNFIYEKEDLTIEGTMPLSFQLFYNAMECGKQENLGEGWSHNYGIRLGKIAGEDLLELILEDGREVPYRRKLEGEYASIIGDEGSLSILIIIVLYADINYTEKDDMYESNYFFGHG
jgi:hypothetical protein